MQTSVPISHESPSAATRSTPLWLHAGGVLAFYALVFVLFFSPVLLSGGLLAPGDGFNQSLSAFRWGFDLWTPYLFSGFPQFADPQAMVWYLPRLLFKPLSWNAFLISGYVLAASFTYGYVHRVTRSRFAALFAGLAYGMSGFFVAHLGHTMIVHAGAWLPLIIWSVESLRERFSLGWLAALASGVALCIMAGHPQIMVYSLGLAGCYALVMAWNGFKPNWRLLASAGSGVLLGIMLAGIQLLPNLELSRLSLRAAMDFPTFVLFSLEPKYAILLLFPYLFGGSHGSLYHTPYFGPPNLTELTGYVGWLPLILAGILLMRPKNRIVGFWLAVAGLSFLLTLGSTTPLAKLMFQVPGYNMFRVPARHFLEFSFALSALAGIAVATRPERRTGVIVASLTVCLAVGSLLLILFKRQTILENAHQIGLLDFTLDPSKNPAVSLPVAFAFASAGAVVFFLSKRGLLPRTLLMGVLVLDLMSFGWFYEWKYWAPSNEILSRPPVQDTEFGRVAPLEGYAVTDKTYAPNVSQLLRIYNASGYNPLLLTRYHELSGVVNHGSFNETSLLNENRALDLLGVRKVLLPRTDEAAVQINGIAWSPRSYTFHLAGPRDRALSFDLPDIPADRIHLVSQLHGAAGVRDQAPVARVETIDARGNATFLELHAGTDVSEWAIDRADVARVAQHQRATVFESFPMVDDQGSSYEGHRYMTTLELPPRTLRKLRFVWRGHETASLELSRITLSETTSGRFVPVTLKSGLLSNHARWRPLPDPDPFTEAYENLRAMPRTWLAQEVVTLPPQGVHQAIVTGVLPDGREFEPQRMALVEASVDFTASPRATSSVRMQSQGNDRLVIKTQASEAAYLVVSDTFYPGWRAFVDGVEAPIHVTNYVQRGVVLPAGNHVVEMRFMPRIFIMGVAMTTAGALGFVVIGLWWRLRRTMRRSRDA